ncbi:alpha/beta hydrolase [Numidum massiliense]|uniref:alpha/beta hydrolase n=1 Tax=Numidum massiliense TaxID=1522315 RepID=UPI0006D56D67|nr:alpha/beta hydrolase [Numidum massiliense]
MDIQRIEQTNDNFTINTLRYTPDARKARNLGIVMGHGFSVSKHHLDGLASYLCYIGYEVVNLDFPGHKMGASRGKLTHPEDLIEAVQLARRSTEQSRVVLLGHSMGAAAAVGAATQIDGVVGLVTLGMGANPEARFNNKYVTSALKWGSMYVEDLDGEQFLQHMKKELLPRIQDVTVPALVVGATKDFIIPVSSVKQLAALASGPTAVEILETSHQDLPEDAKKTVRRWLEQTFPA